MVLTYYEYINENRGISNFIKKLATRVSGSIFKEYEKVSDELLAEFTININVKFDEIDKINHIAIIVRSEECNYHSKFITNGSDLLNDLCLEFDLPKKSDLDYNYLHELIIHELTHLYEYYNIVVNRREFPLYNKIKKSLVRTIKQDDFDIFSYFRNLVYLTLDNELNARIAQTYQLLKFEKINDKDQLFNILKTKHIWKKYKEIESFSPKKYTSDLIELVGLDFSKILINQFNKELRLNGVDFSFIKDTNTKEDVIKYFNSWKKRFNYKLKKHLIKLRRAIDEVVKDQKKSDN
jgi:hypothetical protein